MQRGPKIIVPEAQRRSLYERMGRLYSSPMASETRRREREVERHWGILEGRSKPKRALSTTQKGLLLGGSALAGAALAERFDPITFRAMGQEIHASLLGLLGAGVGAYVANRYGYKNTSRALIAGGVGLTVGMAHKAIARRSKAQA